MQEHAVGFGQVEANGVVVNFFDPVKNLAEFGEAERLPFKMIHVERMLAYL